MMTRNHPHDRSNPPDPQEPGPVVPDAAAQTKKRAEFLTGIANEVASKASMVSLQWENAGLKDFAQEVFENGLRPALVDQKNLLPNSEGKVYGKDGNGSGFSYSLRQFGPDGGIQIIITPTDGQSPMIYVYETTERNGVKGMHVYEADRMTQKSVLNVAGPEGFNDRLAADHFKKHIESKLYEIVTRLNN